MTYDEASLHTLDVLVLVLGRAGGRDPGVVDEDVDPSVPAQDGTDQGGPVLGPAHVAPGARRTAALRRFFDRSRRRHNRRLRVRRYTGTWTITGPGPKGERWRPWVTL